MSLVTQRLDPLLNGVSQAPPDLRPTSQGEEQINGMSDPVTGLRPRNGTHKLALLAGGVIANLKLSPSHIFNSRGEDFILVSPGGTPAVYRLSDGAAQTITVAPGTTLPALNRTFKAATAADTTYLVDTSLVVAKGASTSAPVGHFRVLVVKRISAGTKYSVTINNTTSSITLPTPFAPADNEAALHTVAKMLRDQMVLVDLNVPPGGMIVADAFGLVFLGTSDFTVSCGDNSEAGGCMQVVSDSTHSVADLPVLPPTGNGKMVKVTGLAGDASDDYWVKWDETEKAWRECSAPGLLNALDPTTLPWQLVRTDTGWTFGHVPWASRDAGDDKTNPFPSFVGKAINDLAVFEGRLCLLAGTTLALSATNEPGRFFRVRVAELLPTEPIDVTSSTSTAAFNHVVNWMGTLTVLTDRGPFAVTGQPALTPTTIRLDDIIALATSPRVRPVVLGSRLFCVRATAQGTQVFDVAQSEYGGPPRPVDLTTHVPTYLQGAPKKVVGDAGLGILFVQTVGHLYVYRYQLNGDQRQQASWSEWTFDQCTIDDIALRDGTLYLLTKRPWAGDLTQAAIHIETIDLRTPAAPGTDLVDIPEYGTGQAFTFSYTLSQIYLRDRDNSPRTDGRLTLRYLMVRHVGSGLTVSRQLAGRPVPTPITAAAGEGSLTLRVPIQCKSADVTITLSSSKASTITGVEWEGTFTNRATRV